MSATGLATARFARLLPNAPFYLLTGGAFALLTIARTAQSGMFLDGVTYASISRNLAEGRGGLWDPFYTSTLYASFHDHPPLGFGLQAAAFAIFGDHLAVERIYSVLLGGVTALLMIHIWRRTGHDTAYDWLPLVFWLVPPAVSWSIVNNMLEVTQAAFTTFAVLAFVRSLDRSRLWWIWAASAGASVAAAVLTKGPTGLFPLAAPCIAVSLMRNRAAEALRSGAAMFVTVAVGAALVLVPDASRLSLQTYWNQQVASSIRGARGGAGRLSSMAQHLAAPVIMRMSGLSALAWLISRLKRRPGSLLEGGPRTWSIWTWFFLLVALAGSLPVALSARIAGHYFVPSIPLYALGLASLSLPWIGPALDRWRSRPIVRRVVGVLGVLFLVAAIVIPLLGGSLEPRDVAWMSEYRTLSSSIPRGATLGTCEAVREDWGLHAYMQRLFEVSLDPDRGPQQHRFYLQVTDRPCDPPPACESMAVTRRLALYECKVAQK